MNGWSPQELTLPLSPIGASVTDSVISKPSNVTAGGALNCVLAVKCSALTVGAGVTAKIQTGIQDTWFDSKTGAITATGWTFIKLNVEVTADQTYLPLLSKVRLVVSTGAGSAITISQVFILQEL